MLTALCAPVGVPQEVKLVASTKVQVSDLDGSALDDLLDAL